MASLLWLSLNHLHILLCNHLHIFFCMLTGRPLFLSYLNSVNDKPYDASGITWSTNDFARRVYQNLKPDYSSNGLYPLYVYNEMSDLTENNPILSTNKERLLSHEYNKDSNLLPVVDEAELKDLYLFPYQNARLMDTDPKLAIQWSKGKSIFCFSWLDHFCLLFLNNVL